MESTDKLHESNKMKILVYGALFSLLFCWPWIFVGGVGEGDLVDTLALGLIPTIIFTGIIAYRETKTCSTAYRGGIVLALTTALLLVWMSGAVGIFGHSGDPRDLIFLGELAIGIIGALLARFQPQGMARTLIVMAIAQILAGVIGLMAGWGFTLILDGVFAALWLGSAWLFRRAAQEEPPAQQNYLIF